MALQTASCVAARSSQPRRWPSASGLCCGVLLLLTPALCQEKTALVDSPFFLPGVTQYAAVFEADEYRGRAFRVMGSLTPGVKADFATAADACAAVGMGLAGAMTPARKAALDAIIVAADSIMASDGKIACCKGQYWVGGFRTGLSAQECARSPYPRWPYFTPPVVDAAGVAVAEATDYQNCGKGFLEDWAWVRRDAAGTDTFIPWTEVPSSGNWERKEVVGAGGSNQPTGWNGDKRIEPDPSAGKYENCTAAKVYGPTSADILERAVNIAWYRDVGCTAGLDRFVCEFETEEQGVTEALTSAAFNSETNRLQQSAYFIPGMSDEYRETGSDTEVYRVLGIDTATNTTLQAGAAITWYQAQQTCVLLGGSSLAATKDSTRSSARAGLIGAIAAQLRTDVDPDFWISGATEAQGLNVQQTASWQWFEAIDVDRSATIESSQTVAMSTGHAQWEQAWPKSDPEFADDSEDLTSCAITRWNFSSLQDRWQNRICGSKLQYFICAFPSNTTSFVAGTLPEIAVPAGVVLPKSAVAVDPTPPVTPTPGGGDDDNTGAIIGGVVGGVVALLCLLALCLFCMRRKRRSKAEAEQVHMVKESSHSGLKTSSHRAPASGYKGGSNRDLDGAYPLTVKGNDMSVGNRTTTNVPTGTSLYGGDGEYTGGSWKSASTYTGPVRQVGEDTQGHVQTDARVKADIHAMLDSFENTKTKLHAQYRLIGGLDNRREGGQGIVVFVQSDYNSDPWAIKLFGTRRHFEEERQMYTDDSIRHILPDVRDIVDNKDRKLVAPNGYLLPPFMVLDKGESFDEWCKRKEPDFPTALQVLMHVAGKLQSVHATGYAHRDVKPSNTLWTPRTNGWNLIDFASSARIGTVAPLSFSLFYAAPEVIAACERKERTIHVSGALDVWSLGIMAWGLLTGESPWGDAPLHPSGTDTLQTTVRAQLAGRKPFPFEQPLTRKAKAGLGILRESVLRMLARDPLERITIADLLTEWTSLFQGDQTTTMMPESTVEQFAAADAGAGNLPAAAFRTFVPPSSETTNDFVQSASNATSSIKPSDGASMQTASTAGVTTGGPTLDALPAEVPAEHRAEPVRRGAWHAATIETHD